FVFIPIWALNGAMFATVLSEFSVAVYQIYYVVSTKQLEVKLLFRDTAKYLFAGLIMFIITYKIDTNLPSSVPLLMLEVIIGGIIYFVLICVLKTKVYVLLKDIIIR